MNTIFINKENPISYIRSEHVKYEPAEPSKKFRIHAKQLFLTYSRTNLPPEEVLLQLKQKVDFIDKYVYKYFD
jgi:hypothetical protein